MTQLTATFTVTIRTKPDGDYYFDHDDLVRNVVPWIEGGLDDRDDIAEVTITEQPAAVSAAVAPPTNHTALSDREKAMLSFALEIAQEEIHARSLDITDQDGDALVSLRRMADETATRSDVGTEFARQADQPDEAGLAAWEGSLTDETATQTPQPRRGDAFEAWLKAQRNRYDRHGESSEFWHEFDRALDQYRLHADTGTPLGEHVCEGKTVGDCECLEQPAAGARQDGTQP